MVALKKDLVVFLKDNLSSEKGEELKSINSLIDWRVMPAELKTTKKKLVSVRKRAAKSPAVRAKKANFDINA